MKLRRDVSEFGFFPHGYGVAWRKMDSRVSVCYPVPLNLMFGLARSFYHWLRVCITPTTIDKADIRGYERGYAKGTLDEMEHHIRLDEIQKQLARGLVAEETIIRLMNCGKEQE